MFSKILQSLDWLFDRVAVVLGAWFGCQLPQFIQQYTQRLGGHVEELSHLVSKLKQISGHSQLNLHDYAAKFLAFNDPDIVAQGKFLQDILSRLNSYSNSLAHLLESSFWSRWYYFIIEIDPEIAMATFNSFQPGLMLNLEGFFYAIIGILLGYSLYHLLRAAVLTLCRLFFLRRASPPLNHLQ